MSKRKQHTTDTSRYMASQWQLMWWKFKDHRVAVWAMYGLILMYLSAIFCEVIACNDPTRRDVAHKYAPPQGIHLFHDGALRRPFVYPQIRHVDEETRALTYTVDATRPLPIRLWVKGDPYHLWGVIPLDRHLLGLDDGERLYLMGGDRLGRDFFARVIYGGRVSLTIGLIGVTLSLLFGTVIGGISGYYGGMLDHAVQRFSEILRSFPAISLWLALSAAIPPHWPNLRVYFAMTIILSFLGWTALARVVRGKILSLREEDYVMAAKVAGVSETRIIFRHLVPGFMSHLIVTATLAIPGMILAEVSLSFLGLGLRPPTVSWGVLLQDAQNVTAIALYPWLLIPVAFVVATVLMFNFLGDGLRDAADPYGR